MLYASEIEEDVVRLYRNCAKLVRYMCYVRLENKISEPEVKNILQLNKFKDNFIEWKITMV